MVRYLSCGMPGRGDEWPLRSTATMVCDSLADDPATYTSEPFDATAIATLPSPVAATPSIIGTDFPTTSSRFRSNGTACTVPETP